MHIERIKNILLLSLFSLSFLLFTLVLAADSRYVLSESQEMSILDLLEGSNIVFYADIPRYFNPMPVLTLQAYTYDLYGISQTFFGSDAFLREQEGSRLIFSYNEKRLIFSPVDNSIILDIPKGVTTDSWNFAQGARGAEMLAEQYIGYVFGGLMGMELFPTIVSFRGDYIIRFFGSYGGYIVYNSRIRVRVNELGVTQVIFSYASAEGFGSEVLHIVSADEALMALMNHLRSSGVVSDNIIISGMNLVYFLPQVSFGIQNTFPAYVFNVVIDNIQFNYLFNAFNNRFILYEIVR